MHEELLPVTMENKELEALSLKTPKWTTSQASQ